MSEVAFANLGQPHGALFSDVPTVDPFDEDYTWTEEAAPLVIPEVAPNAPENIAALIADVDYWSKAIHEAAQQLRRVSVQLAQMRQDKTL